MRMTHISEGIRIFKHSFDRKIKGYKKYDGNAEEICRQVIADCWNGRYFQTSSGHFCQFFSRDFGICADALLRLGYKENVIKTLDYALGIYSKHRKITVAITPKGKPFDFPYYGIDSVAFMMGSLRAAEARHLVEKYRDFLNHEVARLFSLAIDQNTGLVKKNKIFSSMKDYAQRQSSCYDNVMVAMLKKELEILKLNNPFKEYNYEKIIKENFWNGSYFLDDLSGKRYVAGDANIFPFWTRTFKSREMLKKSILSVKEAGLDKPFPLKYVNKEAKQDMIAYEILVKGWQTDSIWTQLGPIYISLLEKTDRKEAAEQLNTYRKIIEERKNYIEVYDASGNPFNTAFYHADAGMLWASLYLDLVSE